MEGEACLSRCDHNSTSSRPDRPSIRPGCRWNSSVRNAGKRIRNIVGSAQPRRLISAPLSLVAKFKVVINETLQGLPFKDEKPSPEEASRKRQDRIE